jgi:hypothetical protein
MMIELIDKNSRALSGIRPTVRGGFDYRFNYRRAAAERNGYKRVGPSAKRFGAARPWSRNMADAQLVLIIAPADPKRNTISANGSGAAAISRFAEHGRYLVALRAGAFDYIACPPDPYEVDRIVRSALAESSRLLRRAGSAR